TRTTLLIDGVISMTDNRTQGAELTVQTGTGGIPSVIGQNAFPAQPTDVGCSALVFESRAQHNTEMMSAWSSPHRPFIDVIIEWIDRRNRLKALHIDHQGISWVGIFRMA